MSNAIVPQLITEMINKVNDKTLRQATRQNYRDNLAAIAAQASKAVASFDKEMLKAAQNDKPRKIRSATIG